MARSQSDGSARRVAGAASAGAAATALVFAASALAVRPSPGCWGTCDGDDGPVSGYFVVQDRQVMGFEIELKCLGLREIKQPAGPPVVEGNDLLVPPPGPPPKVGQTYIPPGIAITPSGRFSFNGTALRTTAGGRERKVGVHLVGRFVTATKAKISLTLDYKHCGTQRIVVRHAL